MKLEDFQEMVESSRAGKGKPGSRNSMPTPGGSVTHPPTAIKRELNWVIFSFPKKIQEKNINRTPGVTLSENLLSQEHSGSYHLCNEQLPGPIFYLHFYLTLVTAQLGGSFLTNDEKEAWG